MLIVMKLLPWFNFFIFQILDFHTADFSVYSEHVPVNSMKFEVKFKVLLWMKRKLILLFCEIFYLFLLLKCNQCCI